MVQRLEIEEFDSSNAQTIHSDESVRAVKQIKFCAESGDSLLRQQEPRLALYVNHL